MAKSVSSLVGVMVLLLLYASATAVNGRSLDITTVGKSFNKNKWADAAESLEFQELKSVLGSAGSALNAESFGIATAGRESLQVGFYKNKCPNAELLVFEEVKSAVETNPGLAAGLIRMHFHDCFVRGCDASVLVDSIKDINTAERDSPANKGSLRGFEVIDSAKAKLEKQCPGIVSCADILTFAARDSAKLASPWGAVNWNVKGGRRDGRISKDSDIPANIPSPGGDVKELTNLFASKGLSQQDMVILSGAHTIGVSHCNSFVMDRLYNFSSTHSTDPSLDPYYAQTLKTKCPQGSNDNEVPIDPSTPQILDNQYYTELLNNRGLFVSDATLVTDPNTLNVVRHSASSNFIWWKMFEDAMIRMGEIGVLTGTNGEIRHNCRAIN